MTYRVVAGISALCLLALTPQRAAAGGGGLVAEAQEQLDRLEFEEARRTLARAEHLGGSDVEELAEIYRLSGIVAGAYGDAEAAERHFARWLAIRPDAELGEGFAPRIEKPFARARAEADARGPIRVARTATGDPAAVGLDVKSDPLGMVAGASVRFEVDGVVGEARASGGAPYVLSIPVSARGPVTLAALDRHGNRLAKLSFARASPRVASTPAPAPDHERASSRRPFYAQWFLWGGIATSLSATSAYFGLRAQGDQRELDGMIRNSADYEYAAARDVESSGRRNALWANAAGVGAAAAGVVAAGLLVSQLRADPSPERPAATVFAAPLRRGAAAGVELSF